MTKALLVETEGGKFLLAQESMKISLMEFARVHKAKLSIVETHERPLSLREIINHLNNQEGLRGQAPEHQLTQLLWDPTTNKSEPPNTDGRTIIGKDNYQNFIQQADQVKEYIKSELVEGHWVSLQTITEWIADKDIKLSKGGISRHLQKALDWAVGQGYQKIKEGRTYRVTKEGVVK